VRDHDNLVPFTRLRTHLAIVAINGIISGNPNSESLDQQGSLRGRDWSRKVKMNCAVNAVCRSVAPQPELSTSPRDT
jgi:hypothetical protein